MPQLITTEIEIESSPERVWQELTDFKNYPQWNPFIRQISGKLNEGAELQIYLMPPQGKSIVFHPIIIEIKPTKRFVWLDRVLFAGLFDGEHRFDIETLAENKVKLVHSEKFSGLLSAIILKLVGKQTKAGFVAMNQALKARIEGVSPTSPTPIAQ